MRNFLIAAAVLLVVAAASSRPAAAVDFQGQLLDGKFMRATLFGPFGMQYASVYFTGDRARVQTQDGQIIIMHVSSEDVMDPGFITATGLDGLSYRLSIDPMETMMGGMQMIGPVRGRGSF